MHRFQLAGLLVAMTLSATAPAADLDAQQVKAEADQWFDGRIERLTAPAGWLSLVGLHWIEPGMSTVGSAKDNDIVIATGPAHLGMLVEREGKLEFDYLDSAASKPAPGDSQRYDIDAGRSSLEVLERDDRRALRVRDAQAATRTGFAGIERFPVDPDFRVRAKFEPHPAGTTMPIANVTGSLDPTPNPGLLRFEIRGEPYSIEALEGTETELFLLIADRTSGRETYGGGRMIYVPLPVDGETEIDFNRAYNPPCAFTAFSTCPLPPPENRLDLVVAAGEMNYRGGH